MKFSVREYDAILAGLRLLQRDFDSMLNANPASQLGAIRDIWDDSGDGLTPQEIGRLCEKINT